MKDPRYAKGNMAGGQKTGPSLCIWPSISSQGLAAKAVCSLVRREEDSHGRGSNGEEIFESSRQTTRDGGAPIESCGRRLKRTYDKEDLPLIYRLSGLPIGIVRSVSIRRHHAVYERVCRCKNSDSANTPIGGRDAPHCWRFVLPKGRLGERRMPLLLRSMQIEEAFYGKTWFRIN